MSSLRRIGAEAEDRAASFLLAEGFTVVTRRYKARHGEIDLVALDGNVLVFVEVKERRTEGYVPEEAVGARKASRLAAAAREYLMAMGEIDRPFRFDVIAIDRDGLRHHKDVFRD